MMHLKVLGYLLMQDVTHDILPRAVQGYEKS